MPQESAIFAHHMLTPDGWRQEVRLTVGGDGLIAGLTEAAAPQPGDAVVDALLPGIGNVHSHAFQYAMAGLTEIAASGEDSFWTWREVMYHFLGQLSPDQVGVVARYLYIQMLKAGYTQVGEFHYLHHAPDGNAYANPAEMSLRMLDAAAETGIALTHMPVLYAHSNFGGLPPVPGQRRFVHDLDSYLELVATLQQQFGRQPNLNIGIAPHSLRAVTPEELRFLLDQLPSLGLSQAPIHMHVAEQQKEVNDCIDWSGRRPMEWLLDEMPVDRRWCLIHATHITDAEATRLAASGAVAGLCLSTEGNLGDGIFPAVHYWRQGGRLAIGSDSHVTINPLDEIRLLEYSQRLAKERRALLAELGCSVGASLYDSMARGGAQALGWKAGTIEIGQRADLVAWDLSDPRFAGRDGDQWLDTAIFVLGRAPVSDVWVGGRQVVAGGRHPLEVESSRDYGRLLEVLRG